MNKITNEELTASDSEVSLIPQSVGGEIPEDNVEAQTIASAESVEEVDPDYSAEEIAEAKKHGWKEDNPKGYSPGEFNRRGPLLKSIKEQQAKIGEQLQRMQQLQSDLERRQQEAEQRGYEKALADLQARRDAAIDNADREAVRALDQEFDALRQSRVQKSPVGNMPTEKEVLDYVEQNRHWLSDPSMYAVAQAFEQTLMTQRATLGLPPLSIAEQGIRIKEHVMKEFPHKFEKKVVTDPSPVAPVTKSSVGASSRDKYTINDLTEQQKTIYYRMKKEINPNLTPAEYLEKVLAAGNYRRK